MISHTHKCVFVHIPKCAGVSIEAAFEHRMRDHSRLEELLKRLSVKEKYVTFSVVRNPWDRMVSIYSYLQDRYRRGHREFGAENPVDKMTFAEFVDFSTSGTGIMFRFWFDPQADWISIGGRIAVDHVLRFERLKEELFFLCERYNWKFSLPHLNKSKHDHYVEYYNDVLIEKVANIFKTDIEIFGYTFAEPEKTGSTVKGSTVKMFC